MAAPGRYRSFFLAFVVAAALLAGCTTSSGSGEGQGESTEAATGVGGRHHRARPTAPPPSTEPEVPEGPDAPGEPRPGADLARPGPGGRSRRDERRRRDLRSTRPPVAPTARWSRALAQRWEWTNEGLTLTFRLRSDGVWTNGDPVTAADFEYSWKRALSPQRESANAAQLLGIVGAEAYNACDAENQDCAALREAVAIDAVDDVTLEVRLTRRQPWFVFRVADPAFLPGSRADGARVPRTVGQSREHRHERPVSARRQGPGYFADARALGSVARRRRRTARRHRSVRAPGC